MPLPSLVEGGFDPAPSIERYAKDRLDVAIQVPADAAVVREVLSGSLPQPGDPAPSPRFDPDPARPFRERAEPWPPAAQISPGPAPGPAPGRRGASWLSRREVEAAAGAWRDYVAGETLARRVQIGTVPEEADVSRAGDLGGPAVRNALLRPDARKGGNWGGRRRLRPRPLFCPP